MVRCAALVEHVVAGEPDDDLSGADVLLACCTKLAAWHLELRAILLHEEPRAVRDEPAQRRSRLLLLRVLLLLRAPLVWRGLRTHN